MANELTLTGQEALLNIIHGEGQDVPLNPFEKEIRLTTFPVAGTIYGEQLRGLAIRLRAGTDVRFIREPEQDGYAIRVEAVGKVLGYVPDMISEIPANLMDAGKLIYGKIHSCTISYAGADILVDMYMRG